MATSIPGMMDITDAVDALGLCGSLISRYCSEGRIRAYRAGRNWVIPEEEVRRFAKIERRRGNPHRGKKRSTRRSKK